jgi:glycosyltransferase involved in cell wall biosynthesis
MPRFSVVVPTRDRPDLLDFCLGALAAQTFADFEVIVSDNPTRLPVEDVVERWCRPGWRYLRHEQSLPMHDNFERGCAEAQGEYVAVVIDKTVLHPSALEVADQALRAEPADIVTWRNEGYDPVDEDQDVARGRFRPCGVTAESTVYDPTAEVAERFANPTRRGTDPVHYVRGKIVFGAFSRALLDRIGEHTGRVFHPLAPDYTSMVPGCVFADRALDVGRPLLVSYNSGRSNGRQQSLDPAHARQFIEASDPAIVDALPIPGLYASTHNVVAYDLVSSAARCPEGTTPQLDVVNLIRRAREDLDAVVWPDRVERDAQYTIIERAESEHGVKPTSASPQTRRAARAALAGALTRVPPVESLVYRVAGLPNPSGKVFDSPLDAAREADEHYSVGVRA